MQLKHGKNGVVLYGVAEYLGNIRIRPRVPGIYFSPKERMKQIIYIFTFKANIAGPQIKLFHSMIFLYNLNDLLQKLSLLISISLW